MNKISYTIRWQQNYDNWDLLEIPITDFTEARAVLARIMKL